MNRRDRFRKSVKQYAPFVCFLIRCLQLLLATLVIGLYAVHLDVQRRDGTALNPSFLFALITGSVSAVTCLVYGILAKRDIEHLKCFAWDALLFLVWAAVFGLFAKLILYRSDDPKDMFENTNTQRMKNAVWIDLISAVLWFVTACWGGFIFRHKRRTKIRSTRGNPSNQRRESSVDSAPYAREFTPRQQVEEDFERDPTAGPQHSGYPG